jgi:hypothetical protein
MQLNVFVTDDGTGDGTAPILFLPTSPEAALPPNPRALPWRYFATIEAGDSLLSGDRDAAISAIGDDGYYIANRLIYAPAT